MLLWMLPEPRKGREPKGERLGNCMLKMQLYDEEATVV